MTTRTPHDALVRAVFARRENAAGELRAVLPQAFAERVDWTALRLDDHSFIDQDLLGRHTDLLFTADLAGHDAFVYVLFEHQSTVDALMPLRLLRYMLRIWDRWLADHPSAKRIPVIIPVVLFHGASGWTGPTSMQELLDLEKLGLEAVRAHVPSFELLLDDLSRQSDEQLQSRAMQALGAVALLLLKHGRDAPDLLEKLASWGGMLREVLEAPDGLRALALVMRYVMMVSEFVTVADLEAALVPVLGEHVREVVMTEGQRLIELGEAQGEARGEARGEAKGKALAVVTVLAARGIVVPDEIRDRILSCADIVTLNAWIQRAATAASAAEVVSDG